MNKFKAILATFVLSATLVAAHAQTAPTPPPRPVLGSIASTDTPNGTRVDLLKDQLWCPDGTKAAVAQLMGRVIRACYVIQGDRVQIQDEDGDGGYIPVKNFTKSVDNRF